MATDKLINHSQGESIISQLGDIATSLENVTTLSPAKFGMGYAVCDTAAGTAAKTATIANYRATEGALVTVKFTNGNTATNATLNLNSLGAVPILYKGSAIATDIIGVGDTCTFVYSTANSGSYTIINTDTLSGAGAGTVTSVGATGGIITDQTGGAAINSTGSVKLNLKSNTAYTGTVSNPATTDKIYPVALDGDGHPCVGVPWTDTTYSTFDATHAGLAPAGGTTAGFLKNDGTWATPQDTTYEFADNYDASTNKGATVATVTNAINALDVTGASGIAASKTIASWTQENGAVAITTQDISITGSQISDIDTSFPTTAVDTKVPSTLLVKTALAGKQATLTTGTGIDITSNTIKNTGVTDVDEGTANGTISVTTNGTAADVAVHGLNNAAYKDVDTTINTSSPSDKLPTSAAVNTAIANAVNALPEPMVFKGTVSGTYPATPSVGDTYKATANSNSGVTPAYKIGDTVIYSEPSTGTFEWVVIPSGDEPSGTVTGITGADGVITTNDTTGSSTISTSGTVKLSLVSTHTTTVNAGAATSTANRSYPLAIDGNSKLAVNVPWENTTYEFADSYNASTNKGATVATVTNAINALDVTESSVGATKTIASWKQENGTVAVTTQDISIPIAQVNNVTANTAAVTGVSTTATTSETGYISVSSYNGTTKTLTLKGILAPTASNFVKKS